LPFDVDGDQVFKLKYNAKNPASTLSDGRPWKDYYNSKRKGFTGIRRRANCKGSPRCSNELCWYRKKYGKENRVNFEKINGILVCHSCHSVAEEVACSAVKIWEVNSEKTSVTVYHHGKHSCVAVDKSISDKLADDAAKAFKESRLLKPQRYINDKIISTIESASSGDDVYQIAKELVNNSTLDNIKAKARAEIDHAGHNFDAVGKYRESVCQKLNDPFLIYKVNNKALDGTRPSYVFKTSKEQLQIAVDMDREGNSPLGMEYCHLDGNHKRCPGYKTITLWVYHPYVRQMCKIAIMEAEAEDTASINIFWETLNMAIQEFTGNPSAKFRPHGYMMDEAGGFWASIAKVQGHEDHQRSVSCEKHFDFTVKRHEKSLPGEDIKSEFKFLCESILKAETPPIYDKAAQRMDEFVAVHSHLQSWWDWWQKRKSHVFRAFKPLHNVPKANHAEIGHSRWVKVGAVNLSLVDACREDVAESVKLSAALQEYGTGTFRGGKGPSAPDLQKRRYNQQSKRADAYIAELDKIAQTSTATATATRETESFIDPSSSHRHDPRSRVVHKSARSAPHRPQRSKAFQRSLDIAKKCKNSFTVHRKIVTKDKIQICLKQFTGKTYNVTLSKYPDCEDCTFCTKQNLCSHIVWAYLFACKMPESSPILQQRALTAEELNEVIRSVPTCTSTSASSCSSSASAGNQCSSSGSNTDWVLERYVKARQGKRAQCRKCKTVLNDGNLVIVAHGMWTPPHFNSKGENFSILSKFYFCLNSTCCQHTPAGSSIAPPKHITINEALLEDLKHHEYEQLSSLGLPFAF